MDILEVSINNTIDNPDKLQRLLGEFEQQNNVKVDLQVFDWADAWMEFIRISLYRYGPAISETGDTWMGSLTSRNCLRPFKREEIAAIGGGDVFLGEMWKSCQDFDSHATVAIPWSLDTYLAYYRRDMLKKAGVDEKTAFSNVGAFEAMLKSLQDAGVEIPLAISTGGNSSNILHNASSWVWAMGGDFITPDGKKTLFTQPETLAGLQKYFSLYRFMPKTAQGLDDDNMIQMFVNEGAAVALANPPLLYEIRHRTVPLALIQNIGVAVQPGVPFVGGSNLIIWGHVPVRQESAAVHFIQYLTSAELMLKLFQNTGLIPARMDVLDQLETDPVYSPMAESLKTGRAFKHLRLWGLVEDKLTKALTKIWKTIFSTPKPDLPQIIYDTLSPLEGRLNTILSE